MLDNETKQRINTARDILVGKVPDPKSQVEQITIALTYKFMDDMDQEALAMGGTASFFVGEYEKYGWTKMFDPHLGGFEMLSLYSEAITRMSENPHIETLFRQIFKNAYLPYRDPETLKLFLKTINEFRYDHSEKLGDAFEYLLSVLGSQGDAGQFRTPRHIIEFMVAVVAPKKHETILDPACGTAGFLISAYKFIRQSNTEKLPGDLLSVQDRARMVNNFSGYDISPDMVRLSLVNMYLHGFTNPRIHEYDTLTSEERWHEYADVILANPPFMSPKGGIRPHKKFSVQSKRSEVLFVDYMAEHLTASGRAAIIVPEGIIFQSGTAYKELRKYLVEKNYLWAVVSLPSGVFNPYAGVKTSILFLDKVLARKTNQILFVKVENDGFDLGAQRRPIDKNDLPAAQALMQAWQQAVVEKGGEGFDLTQHTGVSALLVEKSRLSENGEYNLTGERYRIVTKKLFKHQMVSLEEVCDFVRGPFGGSLKKEIFVKDGFLVYEQYHAINNDFSYGRYYIDEQKFLEMKRFEVFPGELLISCSGTMGKVAIVPDNHKKGIINQALLKLTPKNIVNSKFLKYILESNEIQIKYFKNQQGVAIQNVVSVKELKTIQIPLPPLEVQREIVTEIEGYQRIIDGARMVVENWKPNIELELEEARKEAGVEEWEMVKLGEVCVINPKKSEISSISDDIEISFVPMEDLNTNRKYFSPTKVRSKGEVYKGYTYFKENDVLLAKLTPCFENGKSGIAKNLINKIGFGSSEYIVLRAKNMIIPEFVYYVISNRNFLNFGKRIMTGTGGLKRLPIDMVKEYSIELPPINIQEMILSKLDGEYRIVELNRELIQSYKRRINDVINKL